MEKNTTLNFNQLMQNEALSPANRQLINWWCKMYGKTMWMWVAFLLLFLPFTVIAFFFFLQDKIDLIAVLVFVPFELFFIWKAVETLKKNVKIKSALRKGLKQITAGKLIELKTSHGNHLKYTIDNSIIKVNAPGPYNGLTGSRYLKDARIRLETIAINRKENLLLAVAYPDVPQTESRTGMVSPEDKAERNQNEKKDNRHMFKAMSFILPGLFVALLWANGIKHYLLLIFCICIAIGLVVLWATVFKNRRIQSFKEKLMVTGTVTEVIEIKYRIGKYAGYGTMCWYRLGAQMIPGHLNSHEHLVPGNKVCFEYYINEKAERKDVIRIAHLA